MSKLEDETARLASLMRYRILDTDPEGEFDLITDLMRSIFAVPMAALTLIDRDRQWLKSHPGIDLSETARCDAFCNHTIRQPDVLLVVDALQDPRFQNNPYVLGEPHIRSYMGAPLMTPDGYNIGSVCVLDTIPRDFGQVDREVLLTLARLAMSQFELRLIASEDPQTGAVSRRAFLTVLRAALERCRTSAARSALITFDLDHFRAVNETYGHGFGDVVLMAIARTVRRVIRHSDRLGRLGGEEFGVFLEGVDAASALQTAERLRMAIEDTRFPGHPEVHITASFGVCPASTAHGSAEAWVLAASRMTEAAKARGRNCCAGTAEKPAPATETSPRLH